MPVLTFVDTLGIQSFVFASNRLKDVVGGSEPSVSGNIP